MYFKLILLCFFVIGTSFSLAKNSKLSKLIKSDAIEGSGHDKDLESSGSGMHPLDTDDEDAHHHNTEIKTKSNTFDNHPHHNHREDDEDDIDDDDMSEGSGDFAFEKTVNGHIESEKTKSKSTDDETINRHDNNGQNVNIVNRQNSSGVFVVSGGGSNENGAGTGDKHIPTHAPTLPLSSPQPPSPDSSNKDIRLDVTNTINDLNSYQERPGGGSSSSNGKGGSAVPAEGTGGSSPPSSSSSSDSVLINSNLPTNTKNIDHSKTITNNNIDNNNKNINNDISIMNPSDERTSFFAQPGILAAIIGGTVVGLLCAILVVMFIVYRMRKKDEGSYALHNEPKRSPTLGYAKCTNREFFA